MAIVLSVRVPNIGYANVDAAEISTTANISGFGQIHRRRSIIRENGYIVA